MNPPLSHRESHELQGGPLESVSRLNWCPNPNKARLCVCSWDSTCRVYDLNLSTCITSHSLLSFKQQAPVLDSCFNKAGNMLFAGGCESKVKAYDLNMGASQMGQVIATHDEPVFRTRWCEELGVLATAGFEGKIRLWDGKSTKPVFEHSVRKINCLDLKYPWLAIVTGENEALAWNLTKLGNQPPLKLKEPSTLRLQLRDCSLFVDMNKPGLAIAEVAGRVGILHFDRRQEPKTDFTFRCHRVPLRQGMDQIYAVNAIDMNHKYNTVLTVGGDGTMALWDKDNRQKLRAFENIGHPIVDGRLHGSGLAVAYAVGYDWQKGYDQQAIQQSPNRVLIRNLLHDDVKPKPKR